MVKVVDYSEKAIAIFDCKEHKDEIKRLSGKFNRFLKNPENDEKRAGWILSKKKEEYLLSYFIENGIEYEKL